MRENPQRTLRTRKLLLALVFAAMAISLVFAALQRSDWQIPEDARTLKNPLSPSEAALKSARSLFHDNCAQCHGETGKGDGPEGGMYRPAPGDLTDSRRMAAMSDGELFYKITYGRKPMPAFRRKLAGEQRWQLVLLLRTFASKSAMPASPSLPEKIPADRPQ